MRKSGFYPRLAFQNITKNRRFYLPYLLTCMGCAAMFYILMVLSTDVTLRGMYGGRTVQGMLVFGVVIIAIFSLILIFYTNSFLMKRRRRELGLWNILGMEKRHIARVLLLETLFLAGASLIGGLALGMLLTKLLSLLLYRLIALSAPFGMIFSAASCLATVLVFGVIFFLTLLFNLFQIRLARPVELLSSGKAAEKQPKTRWFLTVVGAVTMIAGYTLALIVNDPVFAIGIFFIAVLLVIIGTYCLFTAGSIAALKVMRKNKRFYYQTKHFTAVSGMLHRMKANAAGLASICILCTMILVTVSTTVSLYSGLEDVLQSRYPNDLTVTLTERTEEQERDDLQAVRDAVDASGLVTTVEPYHIAPLRLNCEDDCFGDIAHGFIGDPQTEVVAVLPWHDYAPYAAPEQEAPADGAPLIWSNRRQTGDHIEVLGVPFDVRRLSSFPLHGDASTGLSDVHYLIVSDGDLEKLRAGIRTDDPSMALPFVYEIDINAEGTQEQLLALSNAVTDAVKQPITQTSVDPDDGSVTTYTFYYAYVDSRADGRADFQSTYGGFLFLGLFLGTLFLMATVLIIYYKQLSEGYEDRERFIIMQQVGMSREEVRTSIRGQVLTVFFLPILVAFLHVCGSFKMISMMLSLFNLTNIGLFMLCTVLTAAVFALIYAGVYALTARTYYKIVSQ